MSINEKVSAASLSVISNTVLVILKVIVGLMMGSISVLSEAIHSGLDLIAALIAYFSVKQASKPADEIHKYGHGKIENVSGTVEALLIFAAAIYIIYEAVQKFSDRTHVEALGWGALVMAISALMNFMVSGRLMKVAKKHDSIALEADAWHLRTDVYTSLGVMVGIGLIYITGWQILDPFIAIFVAVLILKAAYKLTKDAFNPILDAKLPDEEEALILSVLANYSSDFLEYHQLRTRKAGADRHIDLHLVVPRDKSIKEVHDLCDQIELEIERLLPNSHVLIHLEPCTDSCDHCSECN